MTTSHSIECPTCMVPLSTASQQRRCTHKHQTDTQSNETNLGWESALVDLRDTVPEAVIVHSRICGSDVEINHRRQRVAAQFVPRMFRSGSWFDLTWFWRNDGRRALHR